jgi:hypothetical protein
MASHHIVQEVRIENGVIFLNVDGRHVDKNLGDLSRRLGAASAEQLGQFEVSPSGYGIHWPLLDEDLSIDGLLGIAHLPEQWKKSA